jgi:hypothetical protein
MAKLRKTPDGFPPLRGKHGNFIYKWYGNDCVVQKLPQRRKRRRQTAKLKATYDNMRQAVRYAQAAIRDPAAKRYYEYASRMLRRSVYIVAKADALRPPSIELRIPSDYQGRAGECVLLPTGDHFRVHTARITVRDTAGDIVETGEAVRQRRKTDFEYHWKRDHPRGQALMVELIAESRAGHRVIIRRGVESPRS